MTPALLLRDGGVSDHDRADVLVADGHIVAIGNALQPPAKALILELNGARILPGLADHHLHLRAWAARRRSVEVGGLHTLAELGAALQQAPRHGGWVRAVGYDDDRLGPLTTHKLEAAAPGAPATRLQHRSGHHWVLNAAGRRAYAEAAGRQAPADGVLWDDDAALRSLPGTVTADELRDCARMLAGFGVTAVTDMTATNGAPDADALRMGVGGLLSLRIFGESGVGLDGIKLVADAGIILDPDELATTLRTGRPVALHVVTEAGIALALSAPLPTSRLRLEHAFLCPPVLIPALRDAGVEIGSHPGFIHSQGDRLRAALSSDEATAYSPLRSWHEAGIPLLGGTDAPFAPVSPWVAMTAAVRRRTAEGSVLGPAEALTPEQAFSLFTADGLRGPARVPRIGLGDVADLCVIDRPWAQARDALSEVSVRYTVRAGSVTFTRRAASPSDPGGRVGT